MLKPRTSLLAAALLTGIGGAAIAQTSATAPTPAVPGEATFDPQQLPAIKGRVAQYSLTPRGDVDGLILDDGTEVHLPPHLGAQLTFAVRPGDTVTVHGLKARAIPMVQAAQVTNDASGQSVTDAGPPDRGGPRGPRDAAGQPMEAQGRVKAQLYGPRGEVNGVLLEDGTQVHLPPPEAQRLLAQLAPGQTIYVSGSGMASGLGKVIGAQAIGPSRAQVAQVAAAPPPPPGGPGHDRPGPPPPPPPGGPGGAGAAPFSAAAPLPPGATPPAPPAPAATPQR